MPASISPCMFESGICLQAFTCVASVANLVWSIANWFPLRDTGFIYLSNFDLESIKNLISQPSIFTSLKWSVYLLVLMHLILHSYFPMSDKWSTLQSNAVIFHPFLANNLIVNLERGQECKAQHTHGMVDLHRRVLQGQFSFKNPVLFDMKSLQGAKVSADIFQCLK